MRIEKEIDVNTNIETAWKVLGLEFANAYKWASSVGHSQGTGNSFNGASCSERGCDMPSMGKTKERLLEFSNEKHLLSYDVYEGMPSIVKQAKNTWQLVPLTQSKSKLKMSMEIQLGGLMGTVMQPVMKIMMSKMGNELVEEFKFYVENGLPHPRKLKAMKKYRG